MSMKVFVVYGTEVCVQCRATERWLSAQGAEVRKVSLDGDEALREYLIDKYQYKSMPVVEVEEDSTGQVLDHWCGFNPNKLKEHVQ